VERLLEGLRILALDLSMSVFSMSTRKPLTA